MSSFNPTRAQAFEAFCATLSELRDKPHVTEVMFRDGWFNRLRKIDSLFASGWYEPPPYGMAVLFASGNNYARMNYQSLRPEASWPGTTEADWSDGFLFAYCSCVSRKTGMPGDFDLTLYFGNDPKLKEHYSHCFATTDKLLNSIGPEDTSRFIFVRSQKMFSDANLRDSVVSFTDTAPLTLGHTFPTLSRSVLASYPSELTIEHKNSIRTARKFLNDLDDWPIEEGMQLTIEPQLCSTLDSTMPKISFHYLLQKKDGKIHICREIDELIKPLLNQK
jgi:hypothetical protein